MKDKKIFMVVLVLIATGLGGLIQWRANSNMADFPTCWTDPHVHGDLDFDFHTLDKHGVPIRCGYLPPRPGSILPRVLGEQIRAEVSDIICYPLVRKECSK